MAHQRQHRRPDGKALYTVARSTGKDGVYVERFPLGAVAPAGVYTAAVTSLPGNFSTGAQTTFAPVQVARSADCR